MPDLVHWYEGMSVYPQHLQVMQHGLTERIHTQRRWSFHYPHGILRMEVSEVHLASGRLAFKTLWVLLPNGWEVRFPEECHLEPLTLPEQTRGPGPLEIRLALPIWHEDAPNSAPLGEEEGDKHPQLLFVTKLVKRRDENDGAAPLDVYIRRPNPRLIIAGEPETGMESFPLLRLKTDARGWVIDPSFVPACLTIQAFKGLWEMLDELNENLSIVRKSVRQRLIGENYVPANIHGAQFANVLHLQSLNKYTAVLDDLLKAPHAEPFEAFVALNGLYGELTGLHTSDERFYSNEERLPRFDHHNCYAAFNWLVDQIKRIANKAAGHSYREIDLVSTGANLRYEVVIEDALLDLKPLEWFLAVRPVNVDSQTLVTLINAGLNFVLGPPDIMDQRTQGIPLGRREYAPDDLPDERGLIYYEMRIWSDEGQAYWSRIMKTTPKKRLALRMWLPTADDRIPPDKRTDLSKTKFSIILRLPRPTSHA